MPATQPRLTLADGLNFVDLYRTEGLQRLDTAFIAYLRAQDAALADQLLAARTQPEALASKEESALLLAIAPHADAYLARLFGIEAEWAALVVAHSALDPLYACKRLFVQRRACKSYPAVQAAAFDGADLRAQVEAVLGAPFTELAFATRAMECMDAKDDATLDSFARFAAWAVATQAMGTESILFRTPKKLEFEQLVITETVRRDDVPMHHRHPSHHARLRDGFALTDAGADLAHALDETNYCIYCHHQGRDSCSKGFLETKPATDTAPATKSFKQNPLGTALAGCPLEEHISEMHELKSHAVPIGALAMVTLNNPMCAGTGHRICNDCMKACVYQKQEPVNIPQAETRILKDVLALPWGFEIYSLLTRWNPLNLRRPTPRAESGKRVLVAGMGPAGYTLAHHLLNDGHAVVGIEGLKVEPLPAQLVGPDFAPLHRIESIWEPLETRAGKGFGGVAEYGITVRWDKNYLTVLRLLLERRAAFALHGGVRFGSTLTPDQAWEMGFDHIALCMGAGSPTIVDMPNGLARGVRTASDFLMNLQLGGAGRMDSLANLQMRLPVVVIGGGLTAIDTTTEALAYYPVQVEKFLQRYELLAAQEGESAVRARWTAEDTEIAEEFLAHARAIRAEKAAATAEHRTPNIHALLDRWGGATLVYRKRLIDAPSYRLNHEEIEKALEEGIFIADQWEPVGVEVDAYGAACGLRIKCTNRSALDGQLNVTGSNGGQETATALSTLHGRIQENSTGSNERILPARSIFMAAGTSPNTVLAREFPDHVTVHGQYFQAVDATGAPVSPQRSTKPDAVHVLMAAQANGRRLSFFGDLHPSYAGNVVKAMASAKQGYPVISALLAESPAASPASLAEFQSRIAQAFGARVHAVHRLTPTIVEVVVHAPLAARNFLPGQFYRLQNMEAHARRVAHNGTTTTLAMEPLAMTGAWVDKDAGLVSVIALEMGGSSNLCAQLQPGEPVVLMGPTGMPTHIPDAGAMLLVGGGLGNAVLFSIGQAARAKGVPVLYFAGYKQLQDRYKVEAIEAAADVVVWCCDEAPGFTPTRPQDKTFVGNIVEAMRAYGAGELGEVVQPLHASTHAVVIGSDRMMHAVAQARKTVLRPYLNPAHEAVGSINSPMQCMMKEICAACLQRHVDPTTGVVRYVYSCFNQDQPLDHVDFAFLNTRLQQNALQEKLTAKWLRYVMGDA